MLRAAGADSGGMPRRRARTVIGVVALVLAGFTALGWGALAWMVSSCCGSPEPPQDGYLAAGVLGAGVLWSLAAWVVARRR